MTDPRTKHRRVEPWHSDSPKKRVELPIALRTIALTMPGPLVPTAIHPSAPSTFMFRFPHDPSPDGLVNLECSLEIHRSISLEDACGVLSRFLLDHGYALGFRASTGFSDDQGRRDLLIEHRETLAAEASESHIAIYEIDLPHGDLLRLELSLPTSSGVGAQTTIEGMLAHLETFCWIQSGAALLPREEGNAGGTGRFATG